jgi:hypothetical protein
MDTLSINSKTAGWNILSKDEQLHWCINGSARAADDMAHSSELIRRLVARGQMACDVETLWRELIQKWSGFGIHIDTGKIILSARCLAEDPVQGIDAELELIFSGLANTWREATSGYSLTIRRYAHPSYQSILALEPKKQVISLILKELEIRPDRWFEALKALTSQNAAFNAKSFEETVQCWLEWGRSEKYIA